MDRIREEVDAIVVALEDTCDELGLDEDERKLFFDYIRNYAEYACAKKRNETERYWFG